MYESFSLSNLLHFSPLLVPFFGLLEKKKQQNLPIFSFNLLMVSFLLFIPVPALCSPLYYWALHILWGRVMSLFNLCFIILNKPMSFSYDRFTLFLLIPNHKFPYYVYCKNIFWETIGFIEFFSNLLCTRNGVIVFLLSFPTC